MPGLPGIRVAGAGTEIGMERSGEDVSGIIGIIGIIGKDGVISANRNQVLWIIGKDWFLSFYSASAQESVSTDGWETGEHLLGDEPCPECRKC